MPIKLRTFICIWLFCPLSCTTPSKGIRAALEKTRHELEQATHAMSPPNLPEEKTIRQDLAHFRSILNKRQSLSLDDWKLHDRLLDYYIQLKQGAERPNSVYIPAGKRWTRKFESYCLDSRRASPNDNETLLWQIAQNKIPYLRELLGIASKGRSLKQGDIQTIIWNLHNKTVWEDYPSSLQRILLSVDPQAAERLPNRLSETVKDEFLDTVRDQIPSASRVEDIVHLVQGKYYDYKTIRSAIESRRSKYELKPIDSVPQIPESPLFAETKSDGFETLEITFYNPTDQDVILDLSQYQLEPLRQDVQPLALIERRGPYSQALISDLERTLYEDMMRLGLGFTPVLNDLIDLFEASTGRDFFNNEWLSNEDRFRSAMGVLAGSGQYYRYAKKVFKGPTSYVRDVRKKYRLLKNTESYKKAEELAHLVHDKNVKIPDDWVPIASKTMKKEGKLQGIEYIHPDNREIRIRVMPGNPNSQFPNSRKPYVRQTVNNKDLDRNGRIVDRESEASHIPLDEYQFFEFWKGHEKK
jgi:hypothetical protein